VTTDGSGSRRPLPTIDRPGGRPAARHRQGRELFGSVRWLLPLGVVVAVSRLALLWLAAHPELYGGPAADVTNEVGLYAGWAEQLLGEGRHPYVDVGIEYPPLVLPFVLAPRLLAGLVGYPSAYVALMLVLDLAGLAGLLLTARRGGSRVGPWLWAVGVPLVGPILYVRLDLIPAVATIWAVERASAGGWAGTGGWLGLGAAAKIYPGLLLPAAVVAAPRRWLTTAAAAAAGGVALLPFADALPAVVQSVLGYHGQRGIQVESLWGAGLLVAQGLGYDVEVGYDFGAFHVASGVSPLLDAVGLALALLAVGAGTAAAARVPRGDAGRLAGVLFATLAATMAVGTVLSPQFLVWLVALAGAATSFTVSAVRRPALLVLVVAALTQLLYPYLYDPLLRGEAVAVGLLVARNLLLLALAAAALVAAGRRPPVPAAPSPQA
jgi:hypothetical protein